MVNHCTATFRRGERGGGGRAASFRVLVLSMAWREGEEAALPPSLRPTLSLVGGGERPASVCAINMPVNVVDRLRDFPRYLMLSINGVEQSLHRHSPNLTSIPPSLAIREGGRLQCSEVALALAATPSIDPPSVLQCVLSWISVSLLSRPEFVQWGAKSSPVQWRS